MLFLLRKSRETFELLDLSNSDVSIGDYLIIRDDGNSYRKILLQVVDISYVSISSEFEEFIRISISKEIEIKDYPSDHVMQLTQEILDAKVLLCKARGSIESDVFNQGIYWAPSRMRSSVLPLPASELIDALRPLKNIPLNIGYLKDGAPLHIDLTDLDGSLTVIIGRKGTGKSHLAKILLVNLVEHGARCIVFDLNNEYILLKENAKFITLEPGRNLSFNIRDIGKQTFLALMEEIMELPPTSALELSRIWEKLVSTSNLTVKHLKQEVLNSRINEYVKDALLRRIEMLVSSGIISDISTFDLENLMKGKEGKAVIVLLRGLPSIYRRVVVSLIIKKLISLLENDKIDPIFLFAEEAHLYQQISFWEDLVTRMRHIGISPIFVTNEPDAFSDFIYRQADNLFIFNFLNDRDLNTLSKISKLDADSIISMVRSLPSGRVLTVGNLTDGIPIIFDVSKERYFKYGATKKAFKQFYQGQEKNLTLLKPARVVSSSQILKS
jgi:hypothetical protein